MRARLLRLAASLERGSEHPLAAAIVAGAEERGIATQPNDATFNRSPAKACGRVDGRTVSLGNRALLEELGIDRANSRRKPKQLRATDRLSCLSWSMAGGRTASRRRSHQSDNPEAIRNCTSRE